MAEIITSCRWAWRQLTSMRVAIFLLLALAVAAFPGSVLPQRASSPEQVTEFLTSQPRFGAVLDKLGFFQVYSSVWFSAIYLLLFISLIGCILPRTRDLIRTIYAPPVRIPSRLSRFPAYRRMKFTESETGDAPLDVIARRLQQRRRYRVRRFPDGLSAERGHLKEAGNLLFHYGLVGILLAFAWGQLVTYRGQAIVVEGRGFANAIVDYDSFESGAWFQEADLASFSFTLDRFRASFAPNGRPNSFRADVTVERPTPDGTGQESNEAITPNHPISVAGTAVTLSGNGFAPILRFTDAKGKVAFVGPVPFIPQDTNYTSRGVVKVPDVSAGLDQLGFSGVFLPAAARSNGNWISLHPTPVQPLLVLELWRGNLGLDDGIARNAYQLPPDRLTQVLDSANNPIALQIQPGQIVTLPDELGTLEFVEIARFAAFDIRHDPSLSWLFWATGLAALGMCMSLFVPRRRLWVRICPVSGITVIEAAALARGDDAGLEGELAWLFSELPISPIDQEN